MGDPEAVMELLLQTLYFSYPQAQCFIRQVI